jgi:hypothetical protein
VTLAEVVYKTIF